MLQQSRHFDQHHCSTQSECLLVTHHKVISFALLCGNAAPSDTCCAHEKHGRQEACTNAESVKVSSLLLDFPGCLARLFGKACWQGQGQRQGEDGQEAKQEEEVKTDIKSFPAYGCPS